jgi:hypothetical protein
MRTLALMRTLLPSPRLALESNERNLVLLRFSLAVLARGE